MNEETKIKPIGCMNMWSQNPPEYIECQCKNHHKLRAISIGRCYTQYVCDICNITWTVDSSD